MQEKDLDRILYEQIEDRYDYNERYDIDEITEFLLTNYDKSYIMSLSDKERWTLWNDVN